MTKEKHKLVLELTVAILIVLVAVFFWSKSKAKETSATEYLKEDSSHLSTDTISKQVPEKEMRKPSIENLPFREGRGVRAMPNNAFGAGERLVYSVGYGVVKAGEASLEIREITKLDGHKCFHIISGVRSNKFFSLFFNVDDKVESFLDVYGLYSLRFEKHLMEGKFRADAYVDFDQRKSLAISGKDTIPTPPYVQDALSVLYYVRAQKLEIGKPILVDNHTDRRNYLLEVRVHRKETVEVPAGKFDCLVVEPLLKGSTVFKHQGKLTVWLTDDEKKMPVLMKSKAIIDSISASLKEYRSGNVGEY